MRRILASLFLLSSVAGAASAQSLSAADRDTGMKYLESTRQGVVDATRGLSEAQWSFKSAPDRWSIAEVAEHIAATEDLLRSMIEGTVLKAPPRAEGEDVAAIDALVMKAIPDRSNKMQAPEPLKPTNRFGSPQDSLKHFLETRFATERLLQERTDLRAHAADSPIGKKLDAYEWVLFIAAHSDRHTRQMLEVKADPNFPKK
ncbi:MAG: DinB family protein [Acidobacteriota bacterium]